MKGETKKKETKYYAPIDSARFRVESAVIIVGRLRSKTMEKKWGAGRERVTDFREENYLEKV